MKTEETTDLQVPEFSLEDMGTPVEFKMPPPLQFDTVGDMLMQWKNFKRQFRVFILAAGLDRVSDIRKSAILLNSIGHEGQNIYYNILKKSEDTPKYEELLQIFDEYFEPRQNELVNTFIFSNRNQEDGESFDTFYSDIRKLVKNCNFQDLENRMLRDRIVMGVIDKKMQRKLLETSNLTLDMAVERCRVAELSQEHARIIQKQEEPMKVEVVRSQQAEAKYSTNSNQVRKNSSSNYNRQFYQCKKCNREHGPRQCPAFGKTCSVCHKMNHFASGCKNKKVDSIEQSNDDDIMVNSVHDL